MSTPPLPIKPSLADEKCANVVYWGGERGTLSQEDATQLIAQHVAASTAYLRTIVMDAIAELEKPEAMRNAGKIALAKEELNRLDGKA